MDDRFADAVAVFLAEQQLTYAELNARANQLAHYLWSLAGPWRRRQLRHGRLGSCQFCQTALAALLDNSQRRLSLGKSCFRFAALLAHRQQPLSQEFSTAQ